MSKNIAADQLEPLMATPMFKLFPELKASLFQSSLLRVVNPQTRIARQDEPIESLTISLDSSLKLVFSTGRIGEENMLERVQRLRPIAFRDMLEGKGFPFSIETEATSTLVQIPKAQINSLLSAKPKLRRSLMAIASSSAIGNYADFLLNLNPLPDVAVSRLHLISLEPTELTRRKKLSLPHSAIVFVQTGYLTVKNLKSIRNELSSQTIGPGSWFLFNPASSIYEISAQTNVYFHSIDLQKTVSPLQKEEQEQYEKEGFWSPDVSFADGTDPRSETPEAILGQKLPISKISDFFNEIDPTKICVGNNSISYAASTITNISVLMGDEPNASNIADEFQSYLQYSPLRAAEALERQGYMTRCLVCEYEDLGRQVMPAIIFLSDRPVVLVNTTYFSATILDPAVGLLNVRKSDFCANWNRQLLEVMHSPFDAAYRDGESKGVLKRPEQLGFLAINFLLDEFQPVFRNQTFMNILSFSLAMTFPMLLHQFIDRVLISSDRSVFTQYLVGFVGLLFMQGIAKFAEHIIDVDLHGRVSLRLGSALYRQFLQLPTSQIDGMRSSDAATRTEQIEYLTSVLIESRVSITTLIVNSTIILIVLYLLSWKVGLIMTTFAAVSMILALKVLKSSAHEALGVNQLKREFQTRMAELMRGFGTIKSLGAEGAIRERTESAAFDVLRIQSSMSGRWFGIDAVIGALGILAICLSLFFSIRDYMSDAISAGNVMALIFYVGMLVSPVVGLIKLLSTKAIIEPVYRVLGDLIRPNLDYSRETGLNAKPHSVDGRVRFDRVSFRYNERGANAISEISFSVNRGDLVVIVGETGSGKSTLARLLACRTKPTLGKIFIDDIDSRALSAARLREQIVLVEQTPILFTGSILSNIAFGDDRPNISRVEAAVKDAGLSAVIESLPGGLHFFISPESCGLSVGQKQQISLARAIYQNPKILVIDESTTHLDPVAQQAISDNLSALMKDKTVILIAHHLSSARSADKIIVLKAGTVIEQGTHGELLKKSGEYAHLYRRAIGGD